MAPWPLNCPLGVPVIVHGRDWSCEEWAPVWRTSWSLTGCSRLAELTSSVCRVNWHHWYSHYVPANLLWHICLDLLLFLIAIFTTEEEETNPPIGTITVLLSYNELQQPLSWWWRHTEGDSFISSSTDYLWFLLLSSGCNGLTCTIKTQSVVYTAALNLYFGDKSR